MASFKDADGDLWVVEIKTRSVLAVKHLCKDASGQPLDLLAIAERGRLDQLIGNTELLVDMMFVLCADQIKERFDVQQYDADNVHMYELIPDWSKEPTMTKASRWFGQRLNGKALEELSAAFQEALIDFFPNESRKTALKLIMEKSRELDRIQCEEAVSQIEQAFEQAVPAIREETKRRAETVLQDLSNAVSGSSPESSE